MIALVVATALAASPAPIETWRASASSPRVVLASDATAPEAAVRIVFLAGAADDLLEEGLTRLTQYAMLHGQQRAPYEKLDAAVFGAGAELHVSTSIRECSFTIAGPASKGFDDAVAMLLAQVFAPQVTQPGVARARQLATTDLLEAGSRDWLEAFVAADVLITEGIDGGGDYNNPIWGDLDTLRRIPMKSVERHIAQKLTPANAIVVAAGKLDVARLKREVARYTGGKQRAFHRPDISKALPLSRVHDAPREVHLLLQSVDVTDARSAALVHVLTAYIRDRLFWKLRKSGHVYSPSIEAVFEEWLDFILISFEVTDGATADLGKVMDDEVQALAHGAVDDESFARAKAMATRSLFDIEDDPSAYVEELAARARGEITVGPEVRAAVDGVDKAALADAAATFLSGKRSVSWVFGQSAVDGAKRASP